MIAGNSLSAATSADTLVMASKLDDVITLDPAEVFEFTGAEFAANVYDRLIGYDRDIRLKACRGNGDARAIGGCMPHD